MHSSVEWLASWAELKSLVYKGLPEVIDRHQCFPYGRFQEPIFSEPRDNPERVEASVDFLYRDHAPVRITLLLEYFPNKGFGISIYSLYGVFHNEQLFDAPEVRPNVIDALNKVGALIEEIKMGAKERRLLGVL
jgi:hypothetical protein